MSEKQTNIISAITGIQNLDNLDEKKYYSNIKPQLYKNNKLVILNEIDSQSYAILNNTIKNKFINSVLPFQMDDSNGSIDINQFNPWIKYYLDVFNVDNDSELYVKLHDCVKNEVLNYILIQCRVNNKNVLQAFMCKVYNNKLYYSFENTESFSTNHVPLLL